MNTIEQLRSEYLQMGSALAGVYRRAPACGCILITPVVYAHA